LLDTFGSFEKLLVDRSYTLKRHRVKVTNQRLASANAIGDGYSFGIVGSVDDYEKLAVSSRRQLARLGQHEVDSVGFLPNERELRLRPKIPQCWRNNRFDGMFP